MKCFRELPGIAKCFRPALASICTTTMMCLTQQCNSPRRQKGTEMCSWNNYIRRLWIWQSTMSSNNFVWVWFRFQQPSWTLFKKGHLLNVWFTSKQFNYLPVNMCTLFAVCWNVTLQCYQGKKNLFLLLPLFDVPLEKSIIRFWITSRICTIH